MFLNIWSPSRLTTIMQALHFDIFLLCSCATFHVNMVHQVSHLMLIQILLIVTIISYHHLQSTSTSNNFVLITKQAEYKYTNITHAHPPTHPPTRTHPYTHTNYLLQYIFKIIRRHVL